MFCNQYLFIIGINNYAIVTKNNIESWFDWSTRALTFSNRPIVIVWPVIIIWLEQNLMELYRPTFNVSA